MKKSAIILSALTTLVLFAPAAFAQEAAAGTGSNTRGMMALAAGFGMALAAFGGALGQGRVAASACEGMARNPGAAANIRTAMILGLVFIETLALFTLAIIYLKA